jgi:hypothetical protein
VPLPLARHDRGQGRLSEAAPRATPAGRQITFPNLTTENIGESSSKPALHLVTGKNAGNLSPQRDLHANRRREFSSYSAPSPVIRNRGLSGKQLPLSIPCFPLAGGPFQGVQAEGVHFSMQVIVRRTHLPQMRITTNTSLQISRKRALACVAGRAGQKPCESARLRDLG